MNKQKQINPRLAHIDPLNLPPVPTAKERAEMTRTATVTADMLKISTRQLSRYVEQGMPRVGSGRNVRYFFPDALRWYMRNNGVRFAMSADPAMFPKAS